MKNEDYMREAIRLSRVGMEENCGGPFGAVVVQSGKIVGSGCNLVTSTNDPTAHAEMVAIRDACQKLETFDLSGCEIYCSCEPCPMCLSAIYWARIERIFYANTKNDAAAIGFDDAFIYNEFSKPTQDRRIPILSISLDEAKLVFALWQQKQDKVMY